MKIISWNVNGYRAAWKKGIADWMKKEKPDVLCLQETKSWAEQLTSDQLSPLGYHSNFSKPERKGYSGVGTFSIDVPGSVQIGYDIPEFDAEGRVIISEHHGFYIANIYFPNGKQNDVRLKYKMDFYAATKEIFTGMVKKGKNVIVLGDYNTAHKPIDLARPKANEKVSGFLPEERAWIDSWIDAGFVDIFREFNQEPEQYTWWDQKSRARERNVGWRIDYFFVNKGMVDKIEKAWILQDVMGSDHCPLALEVRV
ncbi:exodeoxyribonuclease III [Calditrichota bacterium]